MWLMKTLLTSRCINQRGAGQTHNDADSLAEDIIELIAVGRSDPDGFRAVSTELDRMKSLDLKK